MRSRAAGIWSFRQTDRSRPPDGERRLRGRERQVDQVKRGRPGAHAAQPAIWAGYRSQLRLSDGSYDAWGNIMAGAAYLRDLYDRDGVMGFLAAYQASPERHEESMRDGRPHRRETLDYIVRVQRDIGRIGSRSPHLASLAAPGESPIFVTLTVRHSVRPHPLKHALDRKRVVPVSCDQRFAESSYP